MVKTDLTDLSTKIYHLDGANVSIVKAREETCCLLMSRRIINNLIDFAGTALANEGGEHNVLTLQHSFPGVSDKESRHQTLLQSIAAILSQNA